MHLFICIFSLSGAYLIRGCGYVMAAKGAAKPSDVLVSRHKDICNTLTVSRTTLQSLTLKLFQLRIVDQPTKGAVMSRGGSCEGPDILLDYLEMRVDSNPTMLQLVLEAMQENESLREIVDQMKKEWDNEIKQFLLEGIKQV